MATKSAITLAIYILVLPFPSPAPPQPQVFPSPNLVTLGMASCASSQDELGPHHLESTFKSPVWGKGAWEKGTEDSSRACIKLL